MDIQTDELLAERLRFLKQGKQHW